MDEYEEIITDFRKFWEHNCVPNMFIYGPNENDVEHIVENILIREYQDMKNEMILKVTRCDLQETNNLLEKMNYFGSLQTLFSEIKKPKIIHIKLYDDILPETCVNFLDEVFQNINNFRFIITSQHLHTIPIEIQMKMIVFMIPPISSSIDKYEDNTLEDSFDPKYIKNESQLAKDMIFKDEFRNCEYDIKNLISNI